MILHQIEGKFFRFETIFYSICFSNAVFLPMDPPANPVEHDRNYLLSGPNSNTRSMIK